MGRKQVSQQSKKLSKNKKKVKVELDDEDEFQNSEDEYTQSGGETEEGSDDNELDADSTTLDIDPDDEKDLNEDDRYDPVEENEELEDPDKDPDIEDENDDNADADDVEEAGEVAEEDEINEDGDESYPTESRTCHLKNLKNLNKDFIVLDEDDSHMYGKMEYKRVKDVDRISDPIMTYYEMTRIIGTRAQQFNFGAEPLVNGLDGLHPAKMAYIELISKMTPYIIRRHMPGKKYEEWWIEELDIIHVITDDFFVPENFDWDALMSQANKLKKKNNENSSTSDSNTVELVEKSSKKLYGPAKKLKN